MSELSDRIGQSVARSIEFLDDHECGGGRGRYKFSKSAHLPTLYASCYAAMLHGLARTVISAEEAESWAGYLLEHVDADGLFSDPVLDGAGWYRDDPLWCGRSHLTCHVLPALSCLDALDGVGSISWLKQFYGPGAMLEWLESRDWVNRSPWVSNEIMNVGTLLQFETSNFGSEDARRAMVEMLEWLKWGFFDADNGLWGLPRAIDSETLSACIQTSYHIWPLYIWDHRSVPLPSTAVRSVLASQNPLGSFGAGSHNALVPFSGSACEDIDSIAPLSFFSLVCGAEERAEIRGSLERAVEWVLSLQLSSGGFPFVSGQAHYYGHSQLMAMEGEGSTFATWFRTLSLAYALSCIDSNGCDDLFAFCEVPGYQFDYRRTESPKSA